MGQDSDRRPFPDGPSVYHQLRWDPRFDANACEIVLVDRRVGTKVIAFRDFLPNGPIPWHRIVGFRYRGALLWDRATRIDRRAEVLGVLPDTTSAAVVTAPLHRRPLEIPSTLRPTLPASPTVVTWNVLSERYESDVLDHPTRWRAVLDEVATHDPALVAFTEASEAFVAVLREHPFSRERAIITGVHHDVVLVSTVTPVTCESLELEPGREAVVAHFDGLSFAGLHLPSDRHASRRDERARDLHRIADSLLSSNALVLAGDFNAEDAELAPLLEKLHGLDAWEAANPGAPGLTYDVERNPIAGALSARGRSARLDRIVLFGERLTARRASLLGEGQALKSDHFGVLACLEESRPELSHRSAVALLPPAALWGPVQQVRARFDPRFERWPPHVTLVFGFVPPEHLPRHLPTLQRAATSFEGSTVRFDEVLVFEHDQSTTVALAPDARSRTWLTQVQAQLVAAFPACTEQHRGPGRAFTPHLTLGRVARGDRSGLEALRHAAKTMHLEWPVTSLAVLERPDDRFTLHAEVAFGDGRVSRPAPPALTSDPLEQRVRTAITEAAATCGVDVTIQPFGSRVFAPTLEGTDLDLLLTCESGVNAVLDLVAHELGAARIGRNVVRGTGLDLIGVDHQAEDDDSRRFALGARDAQALRQALVWHGRERVFDTLYPLVRTWARRRGLDGNAFGYFGGIGWAVLVAAPLLHDDTLCRVSEANAFEAWRRWAKTLDRHRAVRIDGQTTNTDGFTVFAPAPPDRPITRALITSTERVLLSELHAQRDDDMIEAEAFLRISGPLEHLGDWQHRALAAFTTLERELGPVLRPMGTVLTTPSGFVTRLGLLAPVASRAQRRMSAFLQRSGLARVGAVVE
jgi:poly(A) polymerase